MLGERQKTILDAIIRGYIRTARPISSGDMVRDFGFSMSPATMRNEMLRLDEMGYLEQPHTSAGRVPTHRGYRFFIDNGEREYHLNTRQEATVREVFSHQEKNEFIKNLSQTLADMAGVFAAVGVEDDTAVADAGFSDILEEPEFREVDYIRQFGRLVDALNHDSAAMVRAADGADEAVWIGEENPMKEARFCTMMVSSWEHPAGFNGFFMLVGPMRMAYQRNMALIRFIRNYSHGE